MAEQERDPQLESLLEFLRDERGFDFTGYKRPSLARRIAKRAEAVGVEDFKRRVKIYATDIDEDALTQGRHAVYAAKDVEPVPELLRAKYFESQNSSFAFRPDLRRSVIFGRHDLIQDPPISKVDLLLSRNTLMYFNGDIQSRILLNFHFALTDDGVLMLGKSEVLLTRSQLFQPLDLKRRVFT